MKKHRLLISLLILLLCCACQTQGTESGGDSSLKQEHSAAPQSQVPTLRVLTDLAMGGSFSSRSLMEFLKTVPEYKSEYKLTFQSLPPAENAEAREGEVTRLRIDMMAGKGPDVLILRNFYDRTGVMPDIKNMFPVPQSAMKQNLFLPLDDYIANAKYMDWDKLLPAAMEAGRDEEGRQVLLPMSYSFDTALFEKDQYSLTAQLPMTRMEMLNSAGAGVQWAGLGLMDSFSTAFAGQVDYPGEKLLFTEEELLELVQKSRDLWKEKEAQGEHCSGIGCTVREISVGPINESFFHLKAPDYIMIPGYNSQGGVTAFVNTYAAIYSGTQYPDQAFAFLDSLLSKEAQQQVVDLWGMRLPVHMDLCQKEEKTADGWYLSEWNYQQFTEVRDQINAVEYMTPVVIELMELWPQVNAAEDEAQLEKLVHDSYTRMRMILAES